MKISELESRDSYFVANVSWNDTLNIRSRTSSSSSIVRRIPPDARNVEIDETSCRRRSIDWVRVTHQGKRGWAAARFLKQVSSGKRACEQKFFGSSSTTSSSQTYKVIRVSSNDVLWIRRSAPKGSKVAAIPPNARGVKVGQCKRVSGRSLHWCKVTYRGSSGWSYSKYLAGEQNGKSPR